MVKAARRTLLLWVTAIVAIAAGCAHLPSADLLSEWRSTRAVQVAGAKGLLPPDKSAAIVDNLRQRVGDLDILQKHIAVEQAIVGAPLVAGNKLVLLQDGPATYRAMMAALRAASDSINLEVYIFEGDEVGREFADLLLEKRAQGIPVNLIYDSVGGLDTPASFFDRLRAGGVNVLEFNPVNPLAAKGDWRINNRDHRKLLIVDGKRAFLGGVNISRVYSSRSPLRSGGGRSGGSSAPGPDAEMPWRDSQIEVEGPAVAEFQKLFMQSWNAQHGPPLPKARYFPQLRPQGTELVRAVDSDASDPQIYLTLLSAIGNAEKKVWLTSAYFAPDPQLLQALQDAARRGVDVRLLLPSQSDFWAVLAAGRAHYGPLLEAGVGIYERRAALLHAKTAVIDGVWSCIGSANMDWRSFLHNREANAVVLGPDFATQMEAAFERDLQQSDRITPEGWPHRSLWERMKEMSARVWEYWL